MWKPDLREHEHFAKLPELVQRQVVEADSGSHAAWILLSYLDGVEWQSESYKMAYDHLQRKVAHGCTDGLCQECDIPKIGA